MNTPRALQDAFTELEHRADAYALSDLPQPVPRHRMRVAAPLAAAACVAAAASVLVWSPWAGRSGQTVHGGPPAATQPSTTSSATASSPAASQAWEPPQTTGELTAQARKILGDTATITVTQDDLRNANTLPRVTVHDSTGRVVTPTAPIPLSQAPNPDDGSGIYGTMTGADGAKGGYDLDVYKSADDDKPFCSSDEGNECVKSQRPGGHLAVGTRHDANAPGAVTYEVMFIRSSDGATVLLHVSNEADPKGMSEKTAEHTPISLEQAIAFVSSDQW